MTKEDETGQEIDEIDVQDDAVEQLPHPPVQIKSRVAIIKNDNGEEFICIPIKAYKYVLCIPPTIALKERFHANSQVKEYPIPLDWGLLTEFYVNGAKTPFQGLTIVLPHQTEVDPFNKIIPPMPRVIIRG